MKPGEEELIMDEVRKELPDRTVRRWPLATLAHLNFCPAWPLSFKMPPFKALSPASIWRICLIN